MKGDDRLMNILLIEDNPGDVLLVEEYVSDLLDKAEITHVSTFHKARELLLENNLFDIILLDLSLPDSDGLNLVDQTLKVANSTPVIILTGYTSLEFSMESLSKGASDYLLKDELSSMLLYKSIVYSIERKRYEAELKVSLKEKDVLLAEIHHRVKNNLAVVSSMMQLQAFEEENKEVQEKLLDSTFRIRTMATIHEILYQSGSFSKLIFTEITEQLIQSIDKVFSNRKTIEYQVKSDKLELNINQAIPCSLIINEVITNIYKHAFVEKEKGKIVINLKIKDDDITIRIVDNGCGLPEDFNFEETGSLGMNIIKILSSQLSGESHYERSGKGTVFELTFKKRDYSGVGSAQVR